MKRIDCLKRFVKEKQIEFHHLDQFLDFNKVSKDTRSLEKSDIYVAIKGERFDGHAFLEQAIELGASCLLLHQRIEHDCPQIVVEDSVLFLQEWAAYYRQNHRAKIIAISGTNGKTTTKEMIFSVLNQDYKAYRTAGNYNNHIGLPLTILNMPESTDVAVIEMGMNHPKEIQNLAKITTADIALLTNIAEGHMAAFSSLDDIYQEKTDLFRYSKKDATLILNCDDERLKNFTSNTQTIKRISSKDKTADFFLEYPEMLKLPNQVKINHVDIHLGIFGKHHVMNAAMAFAIGKLFSVSDEKIQKALKNFKASSGRMEWIAAKPFSFIHDAYNANPASMRASLEFFKTYPNKDTKILVLGDMLELGKISEHEHQNVLDDFASAFDAVFTFGENFGAAESKGSENFSNINKLAEAIQNRFAKGTILLKGSRGMRLERLIDLLREKKRSQNVI